MTHHPVSCHPLSRRRYLQTVAGCGVAATLPMFNSHAFAADAKSAEVPALGSRRELFVDDFLIDRLTGVEQKLQKPVPRDVVITCDAPWEGNTSAYYTLFADGDRFRMYYRGAHFDVAKKASAHPEVTCYAESRDGVRWEKPRLGLFEFQGSKDNNIVWTGAGTHNFTPFRDANPDCAPDARYKALAGGGGGLKPYKSADGLKWSAMSDQAVITDGAFDSQNLAFWDPVRKLYVDYHRKGRNRIRDIMTCTSTDFLQWTKPEFLDYGDAPAEHLYTNAIQSYFRAPHLLLGFPTRFQPAHQQVEPIFMSSRDGRRFRRWSDPLIPITAPQDRDGNRSNYMTWGLLQLPGQDRELSVYATEAYYTGPGSRVRRFTFRTDGFVAVQAGETRGELVTKPFTFSGQQLRINSLARAGGNVRVEVQTAAGQAVPGLELDSCRPLAGDDIDQAVAWNSNATPAKIAGQPVRLRFALANADLYAFRFAD